MRCTPQPHRPWAERFLFFGEWAPPRPIRGSRTDPRNRRGRESEGGVFKLPQGVRGGAPRRKFGLLAPKFNDFQAFLRPLALAQS